MSKHKDDETPEATTAEGEGEGAEVEAASYENGEVIDEPLVNAHVVGVAYDAPTDPAAPIDQGAEG